MSLIMGFDVGAPSADDAKDSGDNKDKKKEKDKKRELVAPTAEVGDSSSFSSSRNEGCSG